MTAKPKRKAAPKAAPQKRGRPRYEPSPSDRNMARTMSAFGIPQLEICTVLNISLPTLHQYFWREIEVGQTEANAKVADSLFKKALSDTPGAVTACIFWLKCRAGWRDGSAPPPGKKELAQMAAVHAGGEESEWGADLHFDGESLN